MERYLPMVAALKAAGIDCPAARYAAYGMIETGEPFAVVARELSVYLGLREDVILEEFGVLCQPEAAAERMGKIVEEVLGFENRIFA